MNRFIFSLMIVLSTTYASIQPILTVESDHSDFQGCVTELFIRDHEQSQKPIALILNVSCPDEESEKSFSFSSLETSKGIEIISQKSRRVVSVLKLKEKISEREYRISYYYLYSGVPPQKFKSIDFLLKRDDRGGWGLYSIKDKEIDNLFLKSRLMGVGVVPQFD